MSGVDRVHLYGEFGPTVTEHLRDRLAPREVVALADADDFEAHVGEIEALMCFRPPGGHWAEAGRLRLVQNGGAGVDSLLPAPDLADDVVVCNAVGIHEPQMPEWILAMLLALSKQLPRLVRQADRHEWRWAMHRPLHGATLVVHGLGHIGRGVADRAAALGMRVLGTQRTPKEVPGVERVVTPDRLAEVLDGADALVVVAPLTEETRGSVGATELAAMAEGAYLVDASRGGVTDVDALVEALGSGRLAGAVMDVFDTEPLPDDSPLWDVPHLLVTPHVAGLSPDYLERLGEVFADNVERLERGEPLRNVVDRDRGY